jgi:hypothetical protein
VRAAPPLTEPLTELSLLGAGAVESLELAGEEGCVDTRGASSLGRSFVLIALGPRPSLLVRDSSAPSNMPMGDRFRHARDVQRRRALHTGPPASLFFAIPSWSLSPFESKSRARRSRRDSIRVEAAPSTSARQVCPRFRGNHPTLRHPGTVAIQATRLRARAPVQSIVVRKASNRSLASKSRRAGDLAHVLRSRVPSA